MASTHTEPASRPQIAASVKYAIAVIAAALRYNEMNAAQGYAAFDVDEDGRVSLDDLTVAADEMDLRLEEPQLKALLQFLDVRGVGSADPDAWAAVMSDADYDDVLRHRVDLDAFPHKTRRQRDLMEREAELLQEGGWDLPDRGVDVDAFTHKTPLTAEYAAQAQEIAATEEDMVRRQLELLRMQEELLRKEEGLLLEAARTGETPPLSAEQGQHEEHGRLEDFDEFSGPAYQPDQSVTEALDARRDTMVLNLIQATIETMVTEDGSLTKADARYLNTLVREEDARLVEGFNAANGDRQVFFDTVLTDVLQDKARAGMGNQKYSMYKVKSQQVSNDASSFQKKLNRL